MEEIYQLILEYYQLILDYGYFIGEHAVYLFLNLICRPIVYVLLALFYAWEVAPLYIGFTCLYIGEYLHVAYVVCKLCLYIVLKPFAIYVLKPFMLYIIKPYVVYIVEPFIAPFVRPLVIVFYLFLKTVVFPLCLFIYSCILHIYSYILIPLYTVLSIIWGVVYKFLSAYVFFIFDFKYLPILVVLSGICHKSFMFFRTHCFYTFGRYLKCRRKQIKIIFNVHYSLYRYDPLNFFFTALLMIPEYIIYSFKWVHHLLMYKYWVYREKYELLARVAKRGYRKRRVVLPRLTDTRSKYVIYPSIIFMYSLGAYFYIFPRIGLIFIFFYKCILYLIVRLHLEIIIAPCFNFISVVYSVLRYLYVYFTKDLSLLEVFFLTPGVTTWNSLNLVKDAPKVFDFDFVIRTLDIRPLTPERIQDILQSEWDFWSRFAEYHDFLLSTPSCAAPFWTLPGILSFGFALWCMFLFVCIFITSVNFRKQVFFSPEILCFLGALFIGCYEEAVGEVLNRLSYVRLSQYYFIYMPLEELFIYFNLTFPFEKLTRMDEHNIPMVVQGHNEEIPSIYYEPCYPEEFYGRYNRTYIWSNMHSFDRFQYTLRQHFWSGILRRKSFINYETANGLYYKRLVGMSPLRYGSFNLVELLPDSTFEEANKLIAAKRRKMLAGRMMPNNAILYDDRYFWYQTLIKTGKSIDCAEEVKRHKILNQNRLAEWERQQAYRKMFIDYFNMKFRGKKLVLDISRQLFNDALPKYVDDRKLSRSYVISRDVLRVVDAEYLEKRHRERLLVAPLWLDKK